VVAVTTSLRAEPRIDAKVAQEPYSHVFARDVFEQGFYADLLLNLPEDHHYTNRRFPHRGIADVAKLPGPFWHEVRAFFLSKRWMERVGEMFPVIWRSASRRPLLRLIRDTEGYEIRPHTDFKTKAVSMLFYLPADDSMSECGTEILRPKTPMTCGGDAHHKWSSFDTVFMAPFVPNSMLAFARSDVSFHGTRRVGPVVRNQMLFNVDVA
jgi:hypothetical protein